MKKKTFKKLLFLGGTAALLLSGTSYYLHIHSPEHTMNTAQKSSTQKTKKTKEKAEVLLDVPLESQFDSPSLENGCEVTSLSMLLSFYGYETTKNQLAEQLDYVPVFNADGTHGDPNEGFLVISVAETGLWASMFPQLPPLLSKSSKRIITLFQKPMLNSMISKKHYLKEILSGLL